MKNFFFAVLLFLLVLPLHAELPPARRDILTFESRFLPHLDVKNNPAAQVQPRMLRINANFKPLYSQNKKAFFTVGLNYMNFHFDYRGWEYTGETATVDTVHSVGLPLMFRQQMNSPKWSFMTFLVPGVSSDFESVTWHDFNLQGGAIFTHNHNNRRFGLGLVVINNFGQPRIFPALSYEATFYQRHRVSVRAPMETSYTYRWSDAIEIGVMNKTQGTYARIEEEGPYYRKYLSYSLSSIGPMMVWNVAKRVALTFETGWIYRHKLDINNQRHEYRNFDLKESGYLSTGIKIGL